jgi:hypothetical protein
MALAGVVIIRTSGDSLAEEHAVGSSIAMFSSSFFCGKVGHSLLFRFPIDLTLAGLRHALLQVNRSHDRQRLNRIGPDFQTNNRITDVRKANR